MIYVYFANGPRISFFFLMLIIIYPLLIIIKILIYYINTLFGIKYLILIIFYKNIYCVVYKLLHESEMY